MTANIPGNGAQSPQVQSLDGSSTKFACSSSSAEYAVSDRLAYYRLAWVVGGHTNSNYGIAQFLGNCRSDRGHQYDYWNGALNVGAYVQYPAALPGGVRRASLILARLRSEAQEQ